jgi:hypothetical protein
MGFFFANDIANPICFAPAVDLDLDDDFGRRGFLLLKLRGFLFF